MLVNKIGKKAKTEDIELSLSVLGRTWIAHERIKLNSHTSERFPSDQYIPWSEFLCFAF
jgi:hypothetical protein